MLDIFKFLKLLIDTSTLKELLTIFLWVGIKFCTILFLNTASSEWLELYVTLVTYLTKGFVHKRVNIGMTDMTSQSRKCSLFGGEWISLQVTLRNADSWFVNQSDMCASVLHCFVSKVTSCDVKCIRSAMFHGIYIVPCLVLTHFLLAISRPNRCLTFVSSKCYGHNKHRKGK